ncbi:MAG: hypothetical protein PVF70_10890 [Anaerolineales bacterium]|jgi:hypothetical protein
MILIEAAKLLTTPTGNFVYHLMPVLTLALLIVLSQAHWSRQRSSPAQRWLIASCSLLFLHIVWIALESVAMLSSVDGNPLSVSLSHSVSLFGVILLAWSRLFPEPHRLGDRLALGAAALAALNEHQDQSKGLIFADRELEALVERVGGWISIRNQSGEGASLTALLPFSKRSAEHMPARANT